MFGGVLLQGENKETLVRYLLGELSPEEGEKLEEQYFVNDQAWAELQAAETDLIDSYLRNELSKQQHERFENFFLLSPGRRERLEFAKVRMAASSLREEPSAVKSLSWRRRSALQLGFAFAATVLLVAVVAVTIQNFRMRAQLSNLRAQQTNLQQKLADLQQQIANQTAAINPQKPDATELLSADGPTISLLLTPGTLRSPEAGMPVLPLPSVTSTILLVLELRDNHFSSYDVAIRSAEGKELRRQQELKSTQLPTTGPVVTVKLSSKTFRRGDYIATLFANGNHGKAEALDTFTFTVR